MKSQSCILFLLLCKNRLHSTYQKTKIHTECYTFGSAPFCHLSFFIDYFSVGYGGVEQRDAFMQKKRGCFWKEYWWFTQSSTGSDRSFLLGTEGLLQNNNRLMHKHKFKSTSAWPIILQGRVIYSSVPPASSTAQIINLHFGQRHTHTHTQEEKWRNGKLLTQTEMPTEGQKDWDVEEIRSIKIYVKDIHITLL